MSSPALILSYLTSKGETKKRSELLQHLATLTSDVMIESNDSLLYDLLIKAGFDPTKKQYKPDTDIESIKVDLEALLARRFERRSLGRASQLGLRNTIKSFAPDMLMAYTLSKGFHVEGVSLQPFSVFFEGVCMLADISGFTRLSGNFCSAGKYGIDQLQQATNTYLAELVKTVYSYGGDVLKFAGDALVCVFQNKICAGNRSDYTLPDICCNAVKCATELALICTPQLTIHVALSCGPMCFAMLGGHNDVWESLVSGHCFSHLSQCLDEAASKQTVISRQLADTLGPLFGSELKTELLPSGNYRIISVSKINSTAVKKLKKRKSGSIIEDCESRYDTV